MLFGTYIKGPVWGSVTHTAAITQAVVAFVPLLWLAHAGAPA